MSNLSDKEQAVLAGLMKTEIATERPRYAWDENFQRRLLAMLLTDTFFMVQSQGLVQPTYFSNEAHVIIADLLFKYFNKYKSLPESFLLGEELREKTKDRDGAVRLLFQSEFDGLYDYYVPGLATRDALLDKLITFAKAQALKLAFHESLEDIGKAPDEESTWSKVYDRLRQAMMIDRSFEVGMEVFITPEEMFRRMREQMKSGERFTSGFQSIDTALMGNTLKRGEIYSWIGLPGRGKSLALVKAAVENVKIGHKVLYITMEMDEVGITQRFFSQFTRNSINFMLEKEQEICDAVREYVKDKTTKEEQNRCIVRQFPGGTVSVDTIRAYYNSLLMYGFKPDLVIIDYVGEMKNIPGVKTYESMYLTLRELRGFAVEQQFCCMTCVQPNKSASELTEHEYIDENNIGSSFDQFKPLDGFWSINQLDFEKDECVGRGYVIKHRNGRSRFPFYLQFDYDILNIYETSEQKYRIRMNERTAKKADEVNIDGMNVGGKKTKKRWNPIEPDGDE